MKNSYMMLAVTALCAAAGLAEAGQVTVWGDRFDSNRLSGENGTFRGSTGGEFKIQVLSGFAGVTGTYSDTQGSVGLQPGNTFQAFCLERNEYIWNPGRTYDFSVGTGAIQGGVGGGNPDYLSGKTAWLYQSFRYGTLNVNGQGSDSANSRNYDYTAAGREASSLGLQTAIWALENELSAGVGGDVSTEAQVLALTSDLRARAFIHAAFTSSAAQQADALTRVRVLNITSLDTHGNLVFGQSQLTMIPLPTAGGLATIGLFAVAARRRRLA